MRINIRIVDSLASDSNWLDGNKFFSGAKYQIQMEMVYYHQIIQLT